MLTDTDLKKLFHKLVRQFSAKVHFFGSDVTINFHDHASKVQLSTPVYLGSNYIPKSVRECLTQHPLLKHGDMRTTFTIDENNYRIILNYMGTIDRSEDYLFEGLLEDFCALADEWRCLLDERDKNDLVYIHIR
jgi:hypothetical protein